MTDGGRPPSSVRVVGGVPTRRRRSVAPELVAAILAAVVVATVGGGLVAGGTSAVVAPSSSTQASPSSGSTAEPTPAIDETAITALLALNDRLTAAREALVAALAASTFGPSDVATVLRSLNADVVQAAAIAPILERFSASEAVGARLTKYYDDLHQHLSDALVASVQNAPAYRSAAKSTSTILAEVPALNAALEALLIGRSAPSSSPPAPSATPAPSSSAAPGETPAPSTAPSVPASQSVSSGLVNPGFESGVGPPWELSVSGSGAATWTADQADHAGGSTSARVDVTVAGDERAAIAVRQGGLSIVAGSRYVAMITVRAATTREVRLRIASAAGDTYATRLFTVGPGWQVLTIDSTVFATDPGAYLEIDLGRFAVATWLDDASFAQVAATGG